MTQVSIDYEELKKGNPEAFRLLFKNHYPELMAFACRFVDKHTAKDLIQDVFLLYWENRKIIQPTNLRAFLYKALRNKCLDHLKHQTVVDEYEARLRIAEARIAWMEEHTDANDVFSSVVRNDIRAVIEESVNKLPEKCAQAFRLCYFHDIPQKEIAEIMNISIRTVERHVSRAIRFLRVDLRKILLVAFMLLSIK